MNTNKKEMKKQTKEGLLEMIDTDDFEGGEENDLKRSVS
tara:strand:+ start:103 stop:219 length:117 start_codon:yes stop_codon:yes gene_type:complete